MGVVVNEKWAWLKHFRTQYSNRIPFSEILHLPLPYVQVVKAETHSASLVSNSVGTFHKHAKNALSAQIELFHPLPL